MKLAVYGKHFEEGYNDAIRHLLESLLARGHEVVVFHRFLQFLLERELLPQEQVAEFRSHEDIRGCDLFISVGGDGTLLDTLTLVRDSAVPVLGINTGRLGFLSNVSTDEIAWALDCVEHGDYEIDARSLIKVSCEEVDFKGFPFVLNEVTVHKHNEASMVTVDATLGDQFVNTYWADGLIVSTPTGSTAYSLSCGGPIIMPGSDTFVLTPIAPHNLYVRPLVVPSTHRLCLAAQGRTRQHLLSLDSRTFELPSGAKVYLETADFKMLLINLKGQHFLKTIRNKMLWGLDKRN